MYMAIRYIEYVTCLTYYIFSTSKASYFICFSRVSILEFISKCFTVAGTALQRQQTTSQQKRNVYTILIVYNMSYVQLTISSQQKPAGTACVSATTMGANYSRQTGWRAPLVEPGQAHSLCSGLLPT